MGSFANSVFSVLLGWIRTAVNEFWNILSSGEGAVFFCPKGGIFMFYFFGK